MVLGRFYGRFWGAEATLVQGVFGLSTPGDRHQAPSWTNRCCHWALAQKLSLLRHGGNSMSGKPACGFWEVGVFSPQWPRGSVPVLPLPNYMLSHMARGTQWAGLPLRTSESLSFSLTWLNLGLEDRQANSVPSLGLST